MRPRSVGIIRDAGLSRRGADHENDDEGAAFCCAEASGSNQGAARAGDSSSECRPGAGDGDHAANRAAQTGPCQFAGTPPRQAVKSVGDLEPLSSGLRRVTGRVQGPSARRVARIHQIAPVDSAESRRGILSWALKRQRPPTSWRPLPGLRSENELGDHAELTKLVVVLNTKTMRGSAIGSQGCFAHG